MTITANVKAYAEQQEAETGFFRKLTLDEAYAVHQAGFFSSRSSDGPCCQWPKIMPGCPPKNKMGNMIFHSYYLTDTERMKLRG